MDASNRVLWPVGNQQTRNRDSSLSMIEIVWMAILVMIFLAPTVLFVIRQFRAWRQGFPSSAHPAATVDAGEFLLQTVMTKQQAEFRQKYLGKHLVVHKVVAPVGHGESEGATGNDEESPVIKTDSKYKKGDLILLLPTKNEDQDGNNSELDNTDEDDDRPLCAICVAPYQIGEEICSSNNPQCTHIFHKDCIQGWLMVHHQCPFCRKPFLFPAKETD